MLDKFKTLFNKVKGYKTIIFNAALAFAGAAVSLGWLDQAGVDVAMQEADVVWGRIIALVAASNIALRLVTDSPVFKGEG